MATKNDTQLRRGRGRPSTFDRTEALNRAMNLFWEQGYEGTSFDQLIQAMGISPSSFYNTFGSKERLYQDAAEAYASQSRAWFAAELDASSARRGDAGDRLPQRRRDGAEVAPFHGPAGEDDRPQVLAEEHARTGRVVDGGHGAEGEPLPLVAQDREIPDRLG